VSETDRLTLKDARAGSATGGFGPAMQWDTHCLDLHGGP